MNLKNKKIGVLMGGLSKEREVSLRSGAAIAKALRARSYDVTEIDVGQDLPEKLKSSGIEVAFLALHGRYGEDGSVQGLLEVMGIPYTGSGPLASALCMDKQLTKKVLVSELGDDFLTPAWKVVPRSDVSHLVESPLPLPVIIKPNREGSTIGMKIVREEKDFKPALEEAARFDETILIEEFISGTEVTVGLINGCVLPVLEIVPKSGFYDFESKYTKGMTEYIVPARLPQEVQKTLQKISEKIWNVLNLSGFARIDYIVQGQISSEACPYFLEVNTIPGMTETSLVPKAAVSSGIEFEDLCEQILKGASFKV